MKNITNWIWGIILIILGLIMGLNSLEITNIDIFFDGWWTLFIIVPCFIGLFEKNDITGNLIGFLIGVFLLLAANDVIKWVLFGKLIVPIILIVIGISLMFNEVIKRDVTKKIKEKNKDDLELILATFSDQKLEKDNETFKGARLVAVFGGITLDLRKAKFDNEAVINVVSVFGGVDLIIPKEGVNIKVKSTSIFGGVENKVDNDDNNKKTIYIETFCLFGGIDIK